MKLFLLGVAAAFDHEMVTMMKKISGEHKPSVVEIELEWEKPMDPRIEQIKDIITKQHQEEQCPEGNCPCMDCIDKAVKCWYHIAFQKMDDWCAKPSKCPVQKRICKVFKNEPEIFAGMLFVWGHPMDDGYFYCYGHGECKPKDMFPGLNGQGGMMAAVEDFSLADTEWEKQEEPTSELELFHTESEIEELLMMGEEKMFGMELFGGDKYKKCVKKTSCWVMKKVIHKICDWCKNATKKEDVKKCDWMKAHKKFTFGALLVAVQPWKYAMGYCCPDRKPQFKKRFAKKNWGFMKKLNHMSDEVQQNAKEFHA